MIVTDKQFTVLSFLFDVLLSKEALNFHFFVRRKTCNEINTKEYCETRAVRRNEIKIQISIFNKE